MEKKHIWQISQLLSSKKKSPEDQKLLVCFLHLESCIEQIFEDAENEILDFKFSIEISNFFSDFKKKRNRNLLYINIHPSINKMSSYSESFYHTDYYCPTKFYTTRSDKNNAVESLYLGSNCKEEKSLLHIPLRLELDFGIKNTIQIFSEEFDDFCVGNLNLVVWNLKRNLLWFTKRRSTTLMKRF